MLLTHQQMHTSSLISGEIFVRCFNDDSRSRINLQFKWPHKVPSLEVLLIGMSNLLYEKGQMQSCYRELPAAVKADCSVRKKAKARQNGR